MTGSPTPARLCVLPPSHFCERARWGLDRAGVPYVEERWGVGPHIVRARRLAPASHTPILVTGEGVVQGSGAILDRLGLTGGDAELEAWLVDRVGPLVRRYAYAGLLNEPGGNVLAMLLDGVPRGEAMLARLGWPVMRRLMIAAFGARRDDLPKLSARIDEALARFEERLGGRPHLVGDAFGRADLTAASLLSPLARPAVVPLYGRVRMPEAIEADLARWGRGAAMTWVRDTYAAHRGAIESVAC